MNFRTVQYIIIAILFFSCKEKESFNDVDIVVHAVSGLYNPQSFHVDNSKDAMHYALKFEELDGIEVDVQHSLDGTLWMFHDEFLDDRTNKTGKICENSDAVLNQANYTDLNSTPLSPLLSIDWSLNKGTKNIYIDLKNLNSCFSQAYTPNQLIAVLNEIDQNEGLTTYPIINDVVFALAVHDAGFEVYSDAFSFDGANQKLSTFYKGVFIRNGDISSSEAGQTHLK
jgi:hypothetical protein